MPRKKGSAKKRFVACWMPAERKEALRQLAKQRGQTMSDLLNRMVAREVAPQMAEIRSQTHNKS